MNTTDKIMALAEAYADAWGTNRTACRKELRAEIEALVRDAERYRKFLATRPAGTRAVINEAIDAAMQEKQS